MQPAVFARTYPGADAAQVLAAVAADGYAAVQFNLQCAGIASLPDHLPDGLAEQVAHRARAAGLRIAALSGTYNMAHPDPAARAQGRAGFANVVEAARRMGAPVVTLCTGSRDAANLWRAHPDNASPAAWRDLRTELDAALELAERAGVCLGIEPEPANVVRDAVVARRLLDEVGSARLGIVLDAANLLSPERLPRQHAVMAEAFALLGGSLLLAHAKDMDAEGRVVGAGQGAVDLETFVGHLRAVGYDGALVGHGFGPEDARSSAVVLRRLCGGAP
jgi:sugar phosphate isomerase/epimerase